MDRYTQLVVLCEDRQQEVFTRRFLEHCGIIRGRIRYLTSPRGKGAGEQYVCAGYPDEVRGYRRKCHSINIGLVVMTDADIESVSERLKRLDDALEHASVDRRKADERIGIFVPKRNIETWIHHLLGMPVNEVDEYPKLAGRESDCRRVVEALADSRRDPLPDDAPPSLKAACDELTRVL
jgi:hypothetical protein